MRHPIRLLASGLALAACGGGDRAVEPAERAPLVASIHPVASMVRALAGEGRQVAVLLPPGAHADTYEPTPRNARALAGADLVVMVGAGLDAWVATEPGTPVVVLTEGLTLRGRGGDAGSHGTGTGNPHVWLDPVLVRDRFVPRIAEHLGAAYPDDQAAIRARAAAYTDSLTALDEEIARMLAGVRTRRFIAAHPAWSYFADRYGLEEVGVVHPSPGEELGTRELARLVEEARRRGVQAIIAEPQLGRAGVDALAAELGVRVEVADPIGGPGLEGRGSYLDLMRWNARAFARALGSDG